MIMDTDDELKEPFTFLLNHEFIDQIFDVMTHDD
jgi:hypothetical protein